MKNGETVDVNDLQSVLWKDRKRILGMPISFTRYYIKGGRLYLSKGLVNVEEDELLLYRVMDIKLNRSLADKILGVGTITLFTCDKTHCELKIMKVKNPTYVRDLLSQMVEEERTRVRARGTEIFGVGDGEDKNVDDNLFG